MQAGRVNVDTPLSGPQGTPLIAGSAYTNPDRDPTTGTALFGIDFGTDSVYQQIPPNDGTLSLTSPLTGKSSLYTSGPGGASLIGAFGIGGNTAIAPSLIDIAVTPVPEPGEYALMLAGLALVAVAARRRKQGDD